MQAFEAMQIQITNAAGFGKIPYTIMSMTSTGQPLNQKI